jgi:hypothetical protein
MAFKTIRGLTSVLGQGSKIPTPINLDPQNFEGAIVYGDDSFVYYSNGTQWIRLNEGLQGIQGLQGLQ